MKNKEEKILEYLLGEASEEDAFEVERMCKEDPDWQREKLRLLPIIALLEESISENISENLQQKNLKLPDDKRMEILASIGKEEGSKDASSSDGNNSESTKFDKDKINTIWLPLGAAALISAIAFWGYPEEESVPEKTIALTKSSELPVIETEVNFKAIENDAGVVAASEFIDASAPAPEVNDKERILSMDVVEGAIEDEIALGATKELASRSQRDILRLREKAAKDSDLKLMNIENKSIANATTEITPTRNNSPVPLKSSESLTESKAKSEKDSLSVPWESLDGLMGAMQKPKLSFLLNLDGDSLGRIKVLENTNDKLIIERADWPNRKRSFALTKGEYELRIEDSDSQTFIVRGHLQQISQGTKESEGGANQQYEFKAKLAWKLEKNETRTSIPLAPE